MASLCFGDLEQDIDTGSLWRGTKIGFRYTHFLLKKKKNLNNSHNICQPTERDRCVFGYVI